MFPRYYRSDEPAFTDNLRTFADELRAKAKEAEFVATLPEPNAAGKIGKRDFQECAEKSLNELFAARFGALPAITCQDMARILDKPFGRMSDAVKHAVTVIHLLYYARNNKAALASPWPQDEVAVTEVISKFREELYKLDNSPQKTGLVALAKTFRESVVYSKRTAVWFCRDYSGANPD